MTIFGGSTNIAYGCSNTPTRGPIDITPGFPGLTWGSGTSAGQTGGLFQVALTGNYRVSISVTGNLSGGSQTNNLYFFSTTLSAASALPIIGQNRITFFNTVFFNMSQLLQLDSTLWYGCVSSINGGGGYNPITYTSVDTDSNCITLEYIAS
jgi:hypothetical protein